jgi:hypothetical protein
MRKNLDELLATLEAVRSTKYPDVPKELVRKIAITQYSNQDDRGKARTETMNIVADYVNKIKTED